MNDPKDNQPLLFPEEDPEDETASGEVEQEAEDNVDAVDADESDSSDEYDDSDESDESDDSDESDEYDDNDDIFFPESDEPGVHFSGIGGVAMMGGAALALEMDWIVQGSDNPLYPPASHMIKEMGIHVFKGYAESNLEWGPDITVIGNALSRGNPEVEYAIDRRMLTMSLPEWLKLHVLRQRMPIVVAGTHGKTTTTALTAHILDRCGLEPGFLIGGEPLGFPRSARLGAEDCYFVIEGDEYDSAYFDKRAKFLHYLPEAAIVTSIEFDHGDIYNNIEEIERAFRLMLRQIPRAGVLIVCADDPRAAALAEHAFCKTWTYGFEAKADFQGVWHGMRDGFQQFNVTFEREDLGLFEVPLAGRHNALNTLAAIAASIWAELEPEDIATALKTFPGIRRRMEVFHEGRGAIFIDDFAHHPTAIQGTIAAARDRWPDRRLLVCFEPRSNTTVTNRFQDAMVQAFAGADRVWLGPVYRPERTPEAERLDPAVVCRLLTANGVPAEAAPDAAAIAAALKSMVRKDDVVLVLSNGSFGGIYEMLRDIV